MKKQQLTESDAQDAEYSKRLSGGNSNGAYARLAKQFDSQAEDALRLSDLLGDGDVEVVVLVQVDEEVEA